MFLEKNFIASAKSLRTISMTFDVSLATTLDEDNGKYYIPAGTFIDNFDGYATEQVSGIVLDDVYFNTNQEKAIGALIVAGHIFNDRLPVQLDDGAISDLALQGLFFENAPATTVPEDEAQPFDAE